MLPLPRFHCWSLPKPADAIKWALSGFQDGTVWLIFVAFMFALGYEKTGLGRRVALNLVKWLGKKTLGLGYAVALADLVLAPFTPSNTARSGGTIFPVIKNIPPLYGSEPGPTARKIGSYLMWTAFATTCLTSVMFLTGLAPNLLALSLVKTTAKIDISWTEWFMGMAPVGVLLFVFLPWIVYKIYPPELKSSPDVPVWAGEELKKMGRDQLQRDFDGAARVARPGPVDLRWRLYQRHHRCAAGAFVDGDDPHRRMGRRACAQAGVERAHLVRHAGDDGGRTEQSRLSQMVRRTARRAH